MKTLLVLLALFLGSFPIFAQVASDVQCTRCVQQKDIDFGAIGTGRLQKQSVTRNRIAPNAVGITAIDTTQVQARVNGQCGEGSFAYGIRQDGTIQCAAIVVSPFVNSGNSGVAGITCPPDASPVSANCDCDDVNGSRNFGVLFACQVASDGAVAACFPEAITYNPNLPFPRATVVGLCVEAGTVPPIAATSTDELRRKLEIQALVVDTALRAKHER